MKYKRILIVGDAARGKSTLAEKISQKTGIPWHSTDDFFYEIKFSKVRDRAQALEKIKTEFEKDEWIIEGSTFWLFELGLERAEIIIYLQYKNIILQWWRIFWRGVFRKHETLRGTFQLIKHVFYKRYGWGYEKGVATIDQILEPYKRKLVKLSSFMEINSFLSRLE